MRIDQMNLHLVAGALVFQQFGSLYGVIVCAGTTGVDAQVHKVLYTSVYIFGIDIHPFQLGDGGGGGYAFGLAHHLIELVVGHVFAFQVFLAVQHNVEPNHINAVFIGQFLRNVGAGIR